MQGKMTETKWAVLELGIQEVRCIREEEDKREVISAKVLLTPHPTSHSKGTT